jgi:NAD(P)-dependent dehydrogenase (short-subunit alcohol dehydrogenase family)
MTETDTGKVAIVTGASSGIGRAVAQALLAAGWRVALAARREGALRETAAGFDRALVVPTDVADPAAVAALFEKARLAFGRLDLLFNNAGMAPRPRPVEELEDGLIARVIATNLTACVTCAREAFRLMKAQSPGGGRIINNGSISAHVPRPDATLYTATKHAITGLTRSLALDGRKYDIACGQIDIGNVETRMTAAFDAATLQANGTMMPEPRFDLAHVVEAVLYMAGLPLNANVLFMTVMATKMPYVGRG